VKESLAHTKASRNTERENNPLRGANNTAPMGLNQATGYAGGHD